MRSPTTILLVSVLVMAFTVATGAGRCSAKGIQEQYAPTQPPSATEFDGGSHRVIAAKLQAVKARMTGFQSETHLPGPFLETEGFPMASEVASGNSDQIRVAKPAKPAIHNPGSEPGVDNQGRISTSASSHSTWLGGYGTGGCVGSGSYWYKYIMRPNEVMRLIFVLEPGSPDVDIDFFLWEYNSGSPGDLLASAVRTTYPDTIYYHNSSSSNKYVFLECAYYSGATNHVFSFRGNWLPTTKNSSIIMSNYVLWGYPTISNPYDGIEGYNPHASSQRSHWYRWYVPEYPGFDEVKLCLKDVAGDIDYDLLVYESNGTTLITSAQGTTYPDVTGWITDYQGQQVYLEVYAFEQQNAEYRIDAYEWSPTAVEEPGATRRETPAFVATPTIFTERLLLEVEAPATEDVTVKVFNQTGRRVRELALVPDGLKRVAVWDGRDSNGCVLAPGVYFCRLSTGGEMLTRKVMKTD